MRFTALTAARQVEVRRATWDQFDLEAAVWGQARREDQDGQGAFRVPLSRQTLELSL